MKLWVCPNCYRRSMKSDNITMSLCSCGEYMEQGECKKHAQELINEID